MGVPLILSGPRTNMWKNNIKSKCRAEHQSSVESTQSWTHSYRADLCPKKVSSKVVKMSRVVLSACLSVCLVWSKPGCLEWSPGYAPSPSRALGLRVCVWASSSIQTGLFMTWAGSDPTNGDRERWSASGMTAAHSCALKTDTHLNTNTPMDLPWSHLRVWVWDVFPLKSWFSHLPKSIFQRPMIPPATHPVFTFENSLKWFSLQAHGPFRTRNVI